MSTEIDKKFILEYYQKMTDEQITNFLTKDAKGLTVEAQEIAKAEIIRRNLNTEIIKIVELQQETHLHISKAYDPNGCPVEDEKRIWIEKSFNFLLNTFGKSNTQARIVLTPTSKDFPVLYNGSEKSAFETLKIISKQMEVDFEKISLCFYDENIQRIIEGNPNGLYWSNGENDSCEISIVRKLLDEPENMVATLAHEVAHIKLLGENRLKENNEPLTDLTTIFFGLGIFNANSAFQTFADNQSYGWSTSGYLSQMEWGYALSLFALIRNESSPDWANHLSTNVKADFRQSQNFILNNRDKISIEA